MAKELDLLVDQGSRFQLLVQPQIDWLTSLAGYSARGLVKASRTLPGAALLGTLTPYLTVDQVQGTVLLDLPADVSSAWAWDEGEYDLELYDGNAAHTVRFLQGIIKLNKEVTTT